MQRAQEDGGLRLAAPAHRLVDGPGRTGWAWRKLRRQIIDASVDCHLCGQPLRPDLVHPNPMATVVDHIVALVEGGSPTDRANLAAAHRRCNHNKEVSRRRQRKLNASRDW